MAADEDLFLNGAGRTKSIYQQASTGEKHVLFYPTSPAPSLNSDERKSWCQASSSNSTNAQIRNHQPNFNSNSKNSIGMKKSEGAPDSGGQSRPDRDAPDPKCNFRIGIYGWRKKCLYILVLVLLVMVVVNLALTLWVLKVMEFSSEGMGHLKIVTGGLRLEGKAFVLDSLIASSIKSRTGQPIVIESSKNLTLKSRHKNGSLSSWIFLGNDRFECLTNSFRIMDDRGVLLFAANANEVVVGADSLRATGEGGTSFSGSVQTTLVRAESGHELRLESPTSTLAITAAKSIHMESLGGRMKAVALNDILLKSEGGAIKLKTSSVLMPRIPIANLSGPSSTFRSHEVYQLCACESGKLFLASAHSECASDNDERVCR